MLILDKSGIILYNPTASDVTSEAINIDKLVAGDYQIQVLAKGGDTDYTLSLKIDELTGITPEDAIAPGGSGIEPANIANSADIRSSVADTIQQSDEIIGETVPVASTGDDTSNIDGAIATPKEKVKSPTEPLSTDTSDRLNENQSLDTQEESIGSQTDPQLNGQIPSSNDTPSAVNPFTSGKFTVDETGQVGIDYLFDGGRYEGQLAIVSLKGLEGLEPGSEAFIKELARRALSNSELGYVVISDLTDASRFSGQLGEPGWNAGVYQGVKTFAMTPGDEFGVMLIPNGTVAEVFENPAIAGDKRPLFSMATANPNQAFHYGQMADVTGEGNTFVLEDLRVDGWTDKDYNDFIFQVRGAIGTAALMDEVVAPEKGFFRTYYVKLTSKMPM